MWYSTWWGITLIIIGTLVILYLLCFLLRHLPIVGFIFDGIIEVGYAIGDGIGSAAGAIGEGLSDIDIGD